MTVSRFRGLLFELVQQASDLNVHIVDAGQVGLHHVLPFLLAPKMQNLFVHGPWLEQILVSIGAGQGLSVGWQVIEIIRSEPAVTECSREETFQRRPWAH